MRGEICVLGLGKHCLILENLNSYPCPLPSFLFSPLPPPLSDTFNVLSLAISVPIKWQLASPLTLLRIPTIFFPCFSFSIAAFYFLLSGVRSSLFLETGSTRTLSFVSQNSVITLKQKQKNTSYLRAYFLPTVPKSAH